MSALFKSLAVAAISVLATAASTTTVAPTTVARGNSTAGVGAINAVGGFAQSCSSWGGSYGNVNGRGVAIIQATCRTTTGESQTSNINLDLCFANDNGVMNCRPK